MKKLTLTAFLAMISTYSYAVPNIWTSGYGQGWAEYQITNAKNQTLRIACNDGYDDTTDHNITLNDQNIRESAFIINGNAYYPLSMSSDTRNGASDWNKFTKAISKAKAFEIYYNNKKLATFSATSQSVKSVASSLAQCKSLFEKI